MEIEEEGVMKGQMDREIFGSSGPIHLTSIDWNNAYHRTSVAACLVKGVYVLERDRQKNRVGIKSLAAPWWESFHFSLSQTLIDDTDHSIYGAVFLYNPFRHHNYHYTPHSHGPKLPPRHVIAFRGTIKKPLSLPRDLLLDLRCLLDTLHECTRFHHAMHAVETTVAENGGVSSVWLAGHSLGAAIALLAGKTMTRNGFPLETYLFNSPVPSIPTEMLLKNEKLKNGVRVARSLVKAGVATAIKSRQDHKGQEEDPLAELATWIPFLYVNPKDPICAEYIGDFEHMKKMFESGAGEIEKIVMRNSLRKALFGRGTSGSTSTEPLHRLPSAYLTINMKKLPDFKRAHGIHQWWDPALIGHSVLYKLSSVEESNVAVELA